MEDKIKKVKNYLIDIKKRSIVVFAIAVFLSIFIIVFGIYIPMRNEIKDSEIAEFNYIADTKINLILATINKDIQGAKSLSSRTAIKNKLLEFKNRETSFEDLAEFTKSKYFDGANILDNLRVAQRIVNGEVLVSVNKSSSTFNNTITNLSPTEISYFIKNDGNNCLLEVVSPIQNNDLFLGYDVLFFSLNELIEDLNKDYISVVIGKTSTTNSDTIYYNKKLTTDYFVTVSAKKENLFDKMYTISNQVIMNVVIGFITIVLIGYFGIIRFEQKYINSICVDRDIYKTQAMIDSLTGAFTRLFLDKYISENSTNTCAISLLDLDNFKKDNDTYGHQYGDQILISLVQNIQSVLRLKDAIVRLGGDEFLIIFENATDDQAEQIIERIKTRLPKIKYAKNAIDFSYGIIQVDDILNLYDYIELVDAKMYKQKLRKKE